MYKTLKWNVVILFVGSVLRVLSDIITRRFIPRPHQDYIQEEEAVLEESERKGEENSRRHKEPENEMIENLRELNHVVRILEKEILKFKNQEQTLEKELLASSDEAQNMRRLKLVYEKKTQEMHSRLIEAENRNQVLEQQLKSEKQGKERLILEVEQERKMRIESEILAEEERRKFRVLDKIKGDPKKEKAFQKKKQELKKKVGVSIEVRRIGRNGIMGNEDLDKLTPAIIDQMKKVKEQFAKLHRVKKIEYIMNDYLYKQFDETKAKFRSMGRGTNEALVFHGTDRNNINSYA